MVGNHGGLTVGRMAGGGYYCLPAVTWPKNVGKATCSGEGRLSVWEFEDFYVVKRYGDSI